MSIAKILNNLQALVFNNVINSKIIVYVEHHPIHNVHLKPIAPQKKKEFV